MQWTKALEIELFADSELFTAGQTKSRERNTSLQSQAF